MRQGVKRVAVHKVVFGNETIEPAVLTICDGKVIEYNKLTTEPAFTEWRGGVAILEYGPEGKVIAYLEGELII